MTAVLEAPASRRGQRRAPRTRLDPFPRDPLLRWALRLLLALPTLLAGWRATRGTTHELATPNQQLLDHIATIDWSRGDVAWVGEIFPPFSTVLAALIPGGRIGLSVVGALVAGVFLQKMLEIMVQRRFPVTTTVILLAAIAAHPLFAYTVTENLPAFLGLAFFGLGIADVGRFVSWGNTQAGFRAGIFFMLATLSDLSGLLYVLTAAAAAPFLRLGRHRTGGARGANVLVIIYPTLAAVSGILLLNWAFLGAPLGSLGARLTEGMDERWASLPTLYTSVTGLLLVAPVMCAWLMALVVRRLGAIFISSLIFIAINAAFVAGLLPSGSAGNTYLLMTLTAVALIPTAREPVTARLADVVALLLVAIAWLTAFSRESVVAWMNSLAPFTALIG